MMRKIWDIVSVVAVANLLAMLVLLLIGLASGALTGGKLGMVRDVLAGRPLPVVYVPATAPDSDWPAPASAGQTITRDQTRGQVLQLQVDQQLRELKNFQFQLDQARAALDGRIAQFEQQRKNEQAIRQAELATLASEGFRKALVLYESMAPDQAKDLFMTLDDQEVVRLLSAMEERKAAKIAKAFETDAEKARLKKILARLEKPLPEVEAATADAGGPLPRRGGTGGP